MESLLLIPTCLLLGFIVARVASPPKDMVPALNWWVIQVALPALVLELIPRLSFTIDLWFLIVSQWLVFIGAAIVMQLIGSWLGWSRARIGVLILVCGLGNTSFIGYPMLEALRGREGLALGVVADQLGCFIMLSVGGVLVTAVYGGAATSASVIAKKILLFPAFIALIIGLVVGQLGGWPEQIDSILARIGATLTPLALFSVGLRLRLSLYKYQLAPVAIGLSWKLLLAPLVMFGLGSALAVSSAVLSIAVLQAAMAPMISAAILAEQHDLEPDLANAILGIGIILSLLTVTAWHVLLP
ncbi:MAG: AEC family transporter [Paraperlucidibaca sp.]